MQDNKIHSLHGIVRAATARRKSRHTGFTIVELLIVIVVIGILAAITIVAYNGVQSRARDAERQQDMASVQKTLELYYIDHGSFPNTVDIKDPVWRKANLATQDQGMFINPQDSSSSTNSINAAGSAVTTATYSYYSKKSDSSLCMGGESACISYTLTWRLEAGSALQQKIVRH